MPFLSMSKLQRKNLERVKRILRNEVKNKPVQMELKNATTYEGKPAWPVGAIVGIAGIPNPKIVSVA